MSGTVVAASASDKLTEVIMLTLKRVWLAQGIASENPNLMTMVLDILTSLQPPKTKRRKQRPSKKKDKTKNDNTRSTDIDNDKAPDLYERTETKKEDKNDANSSCDDTRDEKQNDKTGERISQNDPFVGDESSLPSHTPATRCEV